MSYIVIQKDHSRYTFIQSDTAPKYSIHIEQLCISGLGSSLCFEYPTKERGNELYKKLMADGFKKFRNMNEVSWYATVENNTPYDEEWKVEGQYLIPVNSRVLQ